MAKRKKGKSKNSKKKRIIRLICIILGLILSLGLVILSPTLVKIIKYDKYAKSVVASSSYATFKASASTVIYDTNDKELCKMSSAKDLYYLHFTDIPQPVIDAFIVTEDRNFYGHFGIDIKGIFRAVVANKKDDGISQGASTITQQLARNIFLTQEVTWERKIKEAFIAMALEKKYEKNDILEFYLNNIYFANGYYGIEAASKGYFSKSVKELTLSEQAFLAAIPNSPTRYNPLENFDATLKRRNLILKQMVDNSKISQEEYQTALDQTITLNPMQDVSNNYVDTYVRKSATESMMASFGFDFRYDFDSEEDYNSYKDTYDTMYANVQKKLIDGGYSIHTTINLDIQAQLQAAIDDKLAKFTAQTDDGIYQLQGAATVIDNSNGNVVAIVGGRSQDLKGYTLNRAYQSYRQPGSSIKPLSVYIPYLQAGNTPDSIVVDEPFSGGPNNSDKSYAGSISLREAVRLSKNTVAWKVYQQITPRTGIGFLTKMQFKNVYMDKDVVAGALGGFTKGVTTEEMASGYAAIENDGVFRKPTCITTITNSDGKTVADETYRGTKVYEQTAARMMTDMLKTVVNSGTGVKANISNGIVAGKTGTTNSDKDSWFVGFSRYYTTSVWVGYDIPQTIKNPGIYSCGIFKQFMTEVHKTLPKEDFPSYTSQNTIQTTSPETTEEETEETVTQASTHEKVTTQKPSETTEKTTESVSEHSSEEKNSSSKEETESTSSTEHDQDEKEENEDNQTVPPDEEKNKFNSIMKQIYKDVDGSDFGDINEILERYR